MKSSVSAANGDSVRWTFMRLGVAETLFVQFAAGLEVTCALRIFIVRDHFEG